MGDGIRNAEWWKWWWCTGDSVSTDVKEQLQIGVAWHSPWGHANKHLLTTQEAYHRPTMPLKSNMVNQWVSGECLKEYGWGISYRSTDDSKAAPSLKAHSSVGDESRKLKLCSTCKQLGGSERLLSIATIIERKRVLLMLSLPKIQGLTKTCVLCTFLVLRGILAGLHPGWHVSTQRKWLHSSRGEEMVTTNPWGLWEYEA